MNLSEIYKKALNFEFLSIEEGVFLFEHAPTPELMTIAHQLRMIQKPDNIVTWQIDRNVNTTNVCVANCKFCNFYRKPGHIDAYITDIETYKVKIEETIKYGGDQLLLQGGHHPELGLKFYCDTFAEIKKNLSGNKTTCTGTTRNCAYLQVGRHYTYRSIKSIKRSRFRFVAWSWC